MSQFVPDLDDITQTSGYKEAMEDIKHGRVYHADSVGRGNALDRYFLVRP